MNPVADKMEIIKTIFQDAKTYAEEQDDVTELIRYLENTNSEFRSVAYEGASMGLALKDFSDIAPHYNIPSFQPSKIHLNRWNSFMNVSQNHAAHICVGLGWAIAQAKPADLSFVNALNPIMQFRVWDGCGYYDGFFRQRQTIQNQNRLDYISEKYFQGYDQGLGRCLWYLCKGDVTKIPEMIQQFSGSRHADLWRGIGIACAYVGGCGPSADRFNTLSLSAGQHRVQLAIGAAMVAKARIHANSITKDIELVCNIWCNLNAQQAMSITVKTEASADSSFTKWLLQMETELVYIVNK